MTQKNRPKYIENQLQEINDILRNERVKYEDRYNNPLFTWFTQHLLSHEQRSPAQEYLHWRKCLPKKHTG